MNPILLTLALLHGVDVASTNVILRQGGVEKNPLMPQQPAWNLTIGAAASAGNLWVIHKIEKHHPKLAKTIGLAAIGIEGAVVAHNLTQIR